MTLRVTGERQKRKHCLRHELAGLLHGHADPLDVRVLLGVDPLERGVLGADGVAHVVGHVAEVGDDGAHLRLQAEGEVSTEFHNIQRRPLIGPPTTLLIFTRY